MQLSQLKVDLFERLEAVRSTWLTNRYKVFLAMTIEWKFDQPRSQIKYRTITFTMLPIANFARLNLCEFNWRIYIFNDFSIAHPEPQVRTGNHSKCFIFFPLFCNMSLCESTNWFKSRLMHNCCLKHASTGSGESRSKSNEMNIWKSHMARFLACDNYRSNLTVQSMFN